MLFIKRKKLVLAILGSFLVSPAHALINIYPENDLTGDEIAPVGSSTSTILLMDKSNFMELGGASEIQENDWQLDSLPLNLVLPSLIPSDYTVSSLLETPVSLSGQYTWPDALKELSKEYGIDVLVDHDKKIVKVVGKDLPVQEVVDEVTTKSVTNDDGSTLLDTASVKEALTTQSRLDEVLGGCDDQLNVNTNVDSERQLLVTHNIDISETSDPCNRAIDLTKVELDPTWIDSQEGDIDEDVLNGAQLLFEKGVVDTDALKASYDKASVLPGDGSFEEYVEFSGNLGSLSPTSHNTFKFDKTLSVTDNIDKWSSVYGYTVINKFKKDYGRAYYLPVDLKFTGTYFGVVSRLLDRYKDATFPLVHTYQKEGQTLHISVGNYKSIK
ncbi:hypothetical protein [Photobacterium leiognathi]|uniref:hypothetical protein n=1 Tax=Photobacterium leiognathi TaxID=553611 RepID=UPI0029821B3D|nr:hypothetical protein [Photobacterium leiognathi]